MELYDGKGNKVGFYGICNWWFESYPEDIFVKKSSEVVKIRNLMKKLIKKSKVSGKKPSLQKMKHITYSIGISILILLMIGCNKYDDEKYGYISGISFPKNDGYFHIGEKADMLVKVQSEWINTLTTRTCTTEFSECIEVEERGAYVMPYEDSYLVPKIIISNDTNCIGKKVKLEVCWRDKYYECPTNQCFDKEKISITIIR